MSLKDSAGDTEDPCLLDVPTRQDHPTLLDHPTHPDPIPLAHPTETDAMWPTTGTSKRRDVYPAPTAAFHASPATTAPNADQAIPTTDTPKDAPKTAETA